MSRSIPDSRSRSESRPRRGGSLGSLLAAITPVQAVVGGALLAAGLVLLRRQPAPAALAAPAATLDELLHFVNDRVAGYEKAVAESHDPELRGYYKQLVSQSQQFATDLNTHLTRAGGGRQTSTTLKGKLYRRFMEAQAALTGRSETSLLAFNLHGEAWALAAYTEALADDTLTGAVRQAVERQHTLSQATHERLEKLLEHEKAQAA